MIDGWPSASLRVPHLLDPVATSEPSLGRASKAMNAGARLQGWVDLFGFSSADLGREFIAWVRARGRPAFGLIVLRPGRHEREMQRGQRDNSAGEYNTPLPASEQLGFGQ